MALFGSETELLRDFFTKILFGHVLRNIVNTVEIGGVNNVCFLKIAENSKLFFALLVDFFFASGYQKIRLDPHGV